MIWLVGGALALQVTARDVPCPFGEGTARVYTALSSDSAGGWDSDLATYSSGGQFREYTLATCSTNLYTVYGKDIGLPIATDERPRVEGALSAAAALVRDRAAPEVWERFRVAAAVYRALGRDDVFLGDLLLEGSWVVRDAAVGLYAGLHGPVEARQLIDAGWGELRKGLDQADRKKVLYNLARVAERGGWRDEREGFLAAFEAAGALSPAEVTALARFRHLTRVVEPEFQDAALAHYLAALRGPIATDQKIRVTYLAADLLRRRGRDSEALPLYFLVANDQKAPEQLRSLGLFFSTELAEKVDPERHGATGARVRGTGK